MLRTGARVCRGFRWGTLGLATLLAVSSLTSDADARGRRHRASAVESYQPAYSSIVLDANSGKVMQETNGDSPRHPASLTKIMTLYLLFERLEAGKIKMSTEMPVSARAAAQAPSKLDLKPGETIQIETAIRAIVTKSANDVAVVVAEALGGDESNFAKLMTAKARALGMTHTTYRNASGLPDDQQITTAHDQAILGRAIQDRFPNYYHYFATRTFVFRGKEMRNHNHLLGTIDGIDGIKTGYIHESGFNIVTSVRRGTRHIVAVVFGGRSAEARDARVRSLIDNNVNIAALKRTAPPVVEGWATAEARTKDVSDKDHTAAIPVPQASPVANSAPQSPALGSTDPIKPNTVKTFTVHPAVMRTASLSPLPSDSRKLTPTPASANTASVTTIAIVKSDTAMQPPPPSAKSDDLVLLTAKESPKKSTKGAHLASAGNSVPITVAAVEPAAKPRAAGGWMIQVGAFPDQKEAEDRLAAAKTKAKEQLGQADPFTEKTTKDAKPFYRARFAGFERDQAENACKHLRRSEIPCILVKN
jgi:D-alanyl-D-alanine carboxypeptidase